MIEISAKIYEKITGISGVKLKHFREVAEKLITDNFGNPILVKMDKLKDGTNEICVIQNPNVRKWR